MIMTKVVTRTSKRVLVMAKDNGIASYLINGLVEPMDHTDLKEVINLLKAR